MLIFVAVLALTLQVLAPYLVWPNRWNIPTHLVTGFCITAYIIPGFFTNLWDGFTEETINAYAGINFLGALALCVGIVLPQFLINHNYPNPFAKFAGVDEKSIIMTRRIIPIFLIAVVGIYIAYAGMGFMPMFAEDPFSARQFRGVYSEPYYRVAIIFRFSFFIISTTMPIVLLVAWEKKSILLYALAFFGVMALFVSLSRSSMATGILFFLGIIAASQKSRWPIRWYIATVIGIFPLGSIFFYYVGQFLNVSAMVDVYTGSVFDNIATGSPDISDQLSWLNGFLRGNYFSYGRTIIGGLVPGNYEWNPSVWTLTYDDIGADISEMITGGLRLTPAEWGYANFGWFGVVVIPLISGILHGFILVYLKRAEGTLNRMQFASALLVYFTLGQQIVQFYTLNMYSIPGIAAAIFFWKANEKALKVRITKFSRRRLYNSRTQNI